LKSIPGIHYSLSCFVMIKNIIFKSSVNKDIEEKTEEYFLQSGFDLKEKKEGFLKFSHRASLLSSWTLDPLKWDSEIIVTFQGYEVSADFTIDSNGQMNTTEEENTWNKFIENYRRFLINNIDFKEENRRELKKARKSGLGYILCAAGGAVAGGIISFALARFTGIKEISYLGIPVLVSVFLSYRIKCNRNKKAITDNE